MSVNAAGMATEFLSAVYSGKTLKPDWKTFKRFWDERKKNKKKTTTQKSF